MNVPALSSIHVYPIKSSGAINLSSTWIDDHGLSFDRRFVVSNLQGQCITARKHPKLCLVQSSLIINGIMLSAPNMPNLIIKYQQITSNYSNVSVWQDDIEAQKCHHSVNTWMSEYLQFPCELLFFGELSKRQVKSSDKEVAFADAYPVLLISKASLQVLNNRTNQTHSMSQFRPNLVVDNCDAFAEDMWKTVKIGQVVFEVVSPCSRCIFTTINPNTGEFNTNREPLTTLKKFRKGADGEIYFGQNLIALNSGQINIGDTIEVISTKTAEEYVDTEKGITEQTLSSPLSTTNFATIAAEPITIKIEEKNVSKKLNIKFDSWNIEHKGNNQDTLLDQGEDAGLIMHYSCRGGNCGRCKVKLQSGEVEQLATDGLMPDEKAEGYILACSSIPKSDLVITKA